MYSAPFSLSVTSYVRMPKCPFIPNRLLVFKGQKFEVILFFFFREREAGGQQER